MIPINCDLAEETSLQELKKGSLTLTPLVDQCSITTGAYSGSSEGIQLVIQAAVQAQKEIGIHPGYPDPGNFGRSRHTWSKAEESEQIAKQLWEVSKLVTQNGGAVAYIKPHGAYYHLINSSREAAIRFCEIVATFNPTLKIVGVPGGACSTVCHQHNLGFRAEVFLDREYSPDGTLVPRNEHSAVVTDKEKALDRYKMFTSEKAIYTLTGTKLVFDKIDTICLHGDNPSALSILRHIRKK